MDLKGKRVLLTGATGGIGGCIARVLAEKGAHIALVGRNTERLSGTKTICEKADCKVIGIEADLTSEEDIVRVVREAEAGLGPIDILINNAGAMSFGPVASSSDEEIRNVVMSNIYGPVRLTKEVLPGMLERKTGLVVNIGSIFGSLSFPYFGIYSASKCAIRGFSEALRREIVGTGVKVSYVAPRGTKTSQSASFLEMAKETGMNLDAPESVARIIVDAIEAERRELYIGWPEKLFVFLNKFIPSVIDKALKKNVDVMSKYL